MASPTLLRGVDIAGGRFRVRRMVNGRKYAELFDTADQANALALEWDRLIKAGLTPAQAPEASTLAEAAEALLVRKQTHVSRKTKRPLRASGIAWWVRALRPWREGPLAALPVNLLTRNQVEDVTLARAAKHPKAARDELDGIKATLRLASARGVTIDAGILSIERPAVTHRKRQALDVDGLELLADCAPDYARNLLLFAGTVGNRIGELFSLTDDRVNLDAGTVFIPAELCKEGKDKTIDLTPEEIALVRLQLIARAPGTALVFPTKTGKPWRHFQFLRLVWYKARTRAGFDDLQPHDLRATAITLMRDAGWPREAVATRVGQTELLETIYDQGDRRARVRATIARLTPVGLRANGGAAGDQTSTRGAAATTPSRAVALGVR